MRVAVIDDLDECRSEIHTYLSRYLNENCVGETPVVDGFSSGEDFLSRFIPEAYDVIFIDQYMAGLSGIETARKIRENDALVALIFVTSSRDHAVDSYGVRACGYLVKPYEYSDFERTMRLAGLEKVRSARFIRMDQDKILLREILWCDQKGHYVQIHTEKRGVIRFRVSFVELSGLLAPYPQFLICYKCCIVNMDRVEYMGKSEFFMDTGEKVLFSQRDRKKIEVLYHTYLFQCGREAELI